MPDMLDLGSLAQMGPDFQSLAQMRGNVPLAPGSGMVGGGAGMALGMEEAQRNSFLQEAAKQAQVRAMLQAMQAQEMSAGHEGRMSQINLATRQAKDAAADPNSIEVPRQKRALELSVTDRKQKEEALRAMETWTNAFSGADGDPVKEEQVRQMMADEGVKFGKKGTNLGELPPDQWRQVMTALRNAQTETAKKDLKETELAVKLKVAQGHDATAMQIAEYKGRLAANMEKLKKENKLDTQNPMWTVQRKAMTEGMSSLNPVEKEMYELGQLAMQVPAYRAELQAVLQNKPQLDLSKVPGAPLKEPELPQSPRAAKLTVIYKTPQEVGEAFKAGKLTEEQARAELAKFGIK